MAIKFEDIRAGTPKQALKAEASQRPASAVEPGGRPAGAKTTDAEKPKRKNR